MLKAWHRNRMGCEDGWGAARPADLGPGSGQEAGCGEAPSAPSAPVRWGAAGLAEGPRLPNQRRQQIRQS